MAYAQWLSEMKQRATNTQYQQQAELEIMRESINANNRELVDFMRHSSTVQQTLQGQITEIKGSIGELVNEMSAITRQRNEIDSRSVNDLSGIREELAARQSETDALK